MQIRTNQECRMGLGESNNKWHKLKWYKCSHWAFGYWMMTKWTKKDLCQPFWASSTECLCSLSPQNKIDTYRERKLFSIILTTTTTITLGDLWASQVRSFSFLRFELLFLKIVWRKCFWWPFVGDRNSHKTPLETRKKRMAIIFTALPLLKLEIFMFALYLQSKNKVRPWLRWDAREFIIWILRRPWNKQSHHLVK